MDCGEEKGEGMGNKNSKTWNYCIFITFLVIPILFCGKYYLQGLALGDADYVQYFSSKQNFSQLLLQGKIQLWNFYLAGGMPQIAITDNYIISTMLAFLPLKEYMYAYYVLHLFVGGLFFYLYLRECKCEKNVAFIIAIVYECSTQINGYRKGHPTIIAAICLWPLIMYLIRKFLSTRNNKWLWLSGIIVALHFTIGIQYTIYGMIILMIYLCLSGINQKYKIITIVKYAIIWIGIFIGSLMFQLLPTLCMMNEYSSMGMSENSYSTFASFSLHPVKYIALIYPKIFKDNPLALGIMNTSENDLELYLGVLIFLLVIYTIIRYRKYREVQIEVVCLLIAMIYSCIAHIPILSKIIFHIPVLGGFRCSGRMLFMVYFFLYTLAARGLNSVFYEIKKMGKDKLFNDIVKKAFIINIILLGTTIICNMIICEEADVLDNLSYIESVFFKPTCVLVLAFVIVKVFDNNVIKSKTTLLGIFIAIVTIVETLPYSSLISSVPISSMTVDNKLESVMQDKYCKVWDAFGNIDGAHISAISQNRNVVDQILTLNSYTAYNNPFLVKYIKNLGEGSVAPFNYSGLQTGSLNVNNNILYQNEFLSMMGVRYIIDSSGVIEKNMGKAYVLDETGKFIINKDKVLLENRDNDDNTISTSFSIPIEKDKLYKIEIVLADKNDENLYWMYLDGGQEQKSQLKNVGSDRLVGIFNTTNLLDSDGNETIHICTQTKLKEICIKTVKVYEVLEEEAYVKVGSTNTSAIYENINADPLIYAPSKIEKVDDTEFLYDTFSDADLDNCAYQNRIDNNLAGNNIDIYDIKLSTNRISAIVKSDVQSYICLSQNYSKNWFVYIDGEKQIVDIVNGIIIGTDVPKGNHKVEFIYFDDCYIWGFIISLLTYIVVLILFLRDGGKQKNDI